MNKDFYESVIEQAKSAYIQYKLLRNDKGEIEDAVFMEMSPVIEKWTGKHPTDLKGKEMSLLVETFNKTLDWLKIYKEGVLKGEEKIYDCYSEVLDIHLNIKVSYPSSDECVVVFWDRTDSRKSMEAMELSQKRVQKQRKAVADLLLHEAIVSGDRSEAIPFITKLLSETIDVARASIWIFSEDQSEMKSISLYEAEDDKHSEGAVLYRKDFPNYFKVMCTETRISAQNAQTDSATNEFTEIYLKPLGIIAMLDAGILIDGKVVGVICLEHVGKEERPWAVDEEAFVSTAAAVISQLMLNEDRRKTELALQESNTHLEQLLNEQMEERQLREDQEALLAEMSTPVTKLWDGILLLPLVGIIDSKRAQNVMTTMLDKISFTQAKVFILDISGIAVVDTAVANYLIKITKATQLMGCTSIISGIAGSVAQTIVELGINVEEIETTGSMQDALKTALERTNASI